VRLDRLRELADCRALIGPFDHQGLLASPAYSLTGFSEQLDDDQLLAQLGVDADAPAGITELRHVRSAAEKRAAEEIANREKCEDFERFKPLFEHVQNDLRTGAHSTRPFVRDSGFLKAEIKAGQFFILGGQTAYVAEVGDSFMAPNGETDARLRVIYSNGTESNLLLRSLQRALYKDEAGRRTYELFNINRTRLENIIHRVFGPARLDIEVKDRFGQPITPREWFLVPVFVIDEAIEKIKDGTITDYVYDPKTASLARAAG
jgi:hypothetical protein